MADETENPDNAAGEALSAQQEKAIAALLSCPTIREAASACEMGETTLYRWLREDDAFKSAYRAARLQVLESATGKLRQAAGTAVDTLVKNLSCGSPNTENSAARTILEMAFKSAEMGEMQERMDALEAMLAAKGDREGPGERRGYP